MELECLNFKLISTVALRNSRFKFDVWHGPVLYDLAVLLGKT